MRCPSCNEPLVISEKHRVEIDYCPRCRGVWLDRGELDKIVERCKHVSLDHDDDDFEYSRPRETTTYSERSQQKKKRGGFLEDLFDF
jgi:hypothetical protein